MSILIKGLKMPQKETSVAIVIEENGDVCVPNEFWDCELLQGVKAVELPDHGDLVDKDKFYIDLMDRGVDNVQTDDYTEICQAVCNAPVVIPAEGSE